MADATIVALYREISRNRMQQDYRIFAGAFPQGELAQRIQELRRQYDPVTARITPPHVTLAGTYWRSGPATRENEAGAIARLHDAAAALPPFQLILGGVRVFPPAGKPVIYLGVELSADLLAVRRTLLDYLGADKHQQRFTPHLTLAMRLSAAQATTMLDDLRGGEWDAGRFAADIPWLQLMQRGPGERAWREIGRAKLSG